MMQALAYYYLATGEGMVYHFFAKSCRTKDDLIFAYLERGHSEYYLQGADFYEGALPKDNEIINSILSEKARNIYNANLEDPIPCYTVIDTYIHVNCS